MPSPINDVDWSANVCQINLISRYFSHFSRVLKQGEELTSKRYMSEGLIQNAGFDFKITKAIKEMTISLIKNCIS